MMPRGSSIEQAREVLREVDANNDGKVDYKEFEHMMQAPSSQNTPQPSMNGAPEAGQTLMVPVAQLQ